MDTRANVNTSDCISCGSCSKVCPVDAINKREEGYYFANAKCISCFACTVVCPTQCIKVESLKEWYENVKKNKIKSVYDFEKNKEI